MYPDQIPLLKIVNKGHVIVPFGSSHFVHTCPSPILASLTERFTRRRGSLKKIFTFVDASQLTNGADQQPGMTEIKLCRNKKQPNRLTSPGVSAKISSDFDR